MIRGKKNPRIRWPGIACFLALAVACVDRPWAETVREMESARGKVRITILPLEAPAPHVIDDPGPIPPADRTAPEARGDSIHPVEAITDFTSFAEMARGAEAMLQVSYFDKASREELRFPLKYSELRRYLRQHPLGYREGSVAERNVALLGDLAGALRIRMLSPAGRTEKP